MAERKKITPEEAWGMTFTRINNALYDYETYLETGEYPVQPSNQEKDTDSFIIHLPNENIYYDSTERTLSLNNNKVTLSPYESRVLTALVQEPRKTQSFRTLYRQVYASDDPNWVNEVSIDYVKQNLRPLMTMVRKRLDLIHPELRDYIVGMRGAGYYWEGEVTN